MVVSLRANDVARAKQKILQKLGEGYSLKRAATAGGVHRKTLTNWRDEDEEFDTQCSEAIEAGTDEIEDVALNQAKRGNGIVTMFLLNARRPDKFKRGVNKEDAAPSISFTLNIGNSVQQTVAVPEATRRGLLSEG